MFRAGFLACPAYCALDTPMSECKCTCPHEDENVLSGYYLEVLDQIMEGRMDYRARGPGNDISTSIYRMLCNNGTDLAPVMGDSLESASPGDISFWPTHPTVDRLFQWRRLNGMTNDWIDNDSWSVQGVDSATASATTCTTCCRTPTCSSTTRARTRTRRCGT